MRTFRSGDRSSASGKVRSYAFSSDESVILPPLDVVSAQAAFAYSTRLARTGYEGFSCRVINTDTTTETDLLPGFTKADVDALGAQDKIEVLTIYDQSGNGEDLVVQTVPKARFEYLTRPMWSWVHVSASCVYASAGGLTIDNPKKFYAVDPRIGSKILGVIRNGLFGSYLFIEDLDGQVWNQRGTYGTDIISYAPDQFRGTQQASSYFISGDDAFRSNGANLTKTSGTNVVGAPTVDGVIYLGDASTSGLVFKGNVGEKLGFATISDGDRDALEPNQQQYYQNGKWIIVHGDSLAGATTLNILVREELGICGVTRNLLGDGWDTQQRGFGGASLDNITPDANLINTGTTVIDPLFRDFAQENILVLWTGWNDMQSDAGDSSATFLANLAIYTAARRAAGWKVVVISVPIANFAGQGANYLTKRLEANAVLAATPAAYCDAYADLSADPIIGDGANTADVTYWTDQLHMTAAGYALVGPHIQTAIESIV